MPSMVDQHTGDDPRLLSFAYIESLMRDDPKAVAFLERKPRYMAKCLGGLAFYLMDAVVIPVENGVTWTDGWVEVDFRARTDPAFRANLVWRNRYRRLAKGYTVVPRLRLRCTARDCVNMLHMAHIAEHGRARTVTKREAALEMVGYFRERLGHSSDAERNA